MMIPDQHLNANPLGWDCDAGTASRPQWYKWLSGFSAFPLSSFTNGNPAEFAGNSLAEILDQPFLDRPVSIFRPVAAIVPPTLTPCWAGRGQWRVPPIPQ
jgi:hypothetical protein